MCRSMNISLDTLVNLKDFEIDNIRVSNLLINCVWNTLTHLKQKKMIYK